MDVADRNVFGSHEIAYECLADVERTERFQSAISEVVRPGDRVVEFGTGTGILAIMAAAAGAERVDAYEISGPTAEIARANISANSLDDIVTVIEDDVVESTFPARPGDGYDVLIAEMITTGLIEEQLIPAFNNALARGLLKSHVHCIPRAQATSLEVVECDFTWFGYRMPTIQIEQSWQDRKVRKLLTAPSVVHEVDLEGAAAARAQVDVAVETHVDVRARGQGVANALRLSGESRLSPATTSGWTQCMNSPVVIPIPARNVEAGEQLHGRLAYQMGGELSSLEWSWL